MSRRAFRPRPAATARRGCRLLGDELDPAEDVHGLGRAWSKLPQVAAGLLREGVSGRDVAA